MLLDLNELNKHWTRNDVSYFVIPLLGKIKGEGIERQHLIPCINTTMFGIRVKTLLRGLIKLKRGQGYIKGPAISDCVGKLWLYVN